MSGRVVDAEVTSRLGPDDLGDIRLVSSRKLLKDVPHRLQLFVVRGDKPQYPAGVGRALDIQPV